MLELGTTLIACGLLSLTGPSHSVSSAPRSAQALTASEVVQMLSSRMNCPILLDMRPSAERFEIDTDGPPETVLERACKALDLVPERSGKVLLLGRRFKNPESRPQLLIEEMTAVAADFNR